jgi:hypothetical protein
MFRTIFTHPQEALQTALGIVRGYVSWLCHDCRRLHVSNISCSSSGGAPQTALGIVIAYNVSWLCHDCRRLHVSNITCSSSGGATQTAFGTLIARAIMAQPTNILFLCVKTVTWTHGTPLWGTDGNSNIEILQRYQNNVLQATVNAPRYIVYLTKSCTQT